MERYYRPGDEPVPRYVLKHKLGKGAFGEVWKATTRSGVDVALKIISLENKGGLKEFRAIRTVKNIHQPNIVPIIDIWLRDADGNLMEDAAEADSVIVRTQAAELIIAMGLGEKNLLDRLKECQKEGSNGIPPAELLRYMEDAARAIDYLNIPQSGSERLAIQHCDIKPGNIMIVGGSAQVCDFGLARVLGGDARATRSGDHMSVPYTSPELFWDASKPSQWSDQYSLAISYVELRTGSLPFEHITPAGMMFAHTQGKLDLSALPALEQAVIRRATSVEPVKRFGTTLEMVQELRRAYDKSSRPSTILGPWYEDSLQKGMEIVPGYRLVRRIGQGGYGTVWEARAPGGRPVALKVICNLEAGTGQQEFKALELIKSLNHLHLLELHAYWLLDGEGNVIPDDVWNEPQAPNASTLVIATKLAQMNLQQRLHECHQTGAAGIPPEELIGYMRQAALAIDYLSQDGHMVSIQHRDIKPENILLVGGGTIQVGDFGLARVLEGTSGAIRRESRAFTPPYAAPELYTDKVTRWTDQYAFALTYYKLRTGVLPFPDTFGRTEIMMTHVEGKLDLSRLPETEANVIAKATVLRSEDRYPTCLAMVDALQRALQADFPIAPFEPAHLPRADHHEGETTPYSPELVGKGPAWDRLHTAKSREGKTGEDLLVMTTHPGSASSSAVTPSPQERQTEPSPTQQVQAVAAIKANKKWGQPAPRSAGRPLQLLFVALFVAVAGGGVYALLFMPKPPGPEVKGDTDRPIERPTRPEPTVRPTMPAKPTHKPTTKQPLDPQVIVQAIAEGERLLDRDPKAALNQFQRALDLITAEKVGENNRSRALLGRVRAQARLGDWEAVANELPAIADPDPKTQAYRDVLGFLAKARTRSETDFVPSDRLTVLAELRSKKVDEQIAVWEKEQIKELSERVCAGVLAEIDQIVGQPLQQESKLDGTFDLMKKLASYDGSYAPGLKEKQEKVVTAFLDSVRPLRESFDPDKPLNPPYVREKAEEAFVRLNRVVDLLARVGESVSPSFAKEIALAGWYKPTPDPRIAKWLEAFHDKEQPSSVPYLWVKAHVQEPNPAGFLAAFDSYDTIDGLIKTNKGVSARERYEKVLVPGTETGELAVRFAQPPKPELKKRFAAFLLSKAHLIRDLPEPAAWNRGLEEVMSACEKAAEVHPEPETWLLCSQIHLEWAHSRGAATEDQKEYLKRAVNDADAASKDHPRKDLVEMARGVALEDLYWIFADPRHYHEAITAYDNAIKHGGNEPKYLLDRGRCHYKRADKDKDADALANAVTDLKQALELGLAGAFRVEGLHWLGMAYQRRPNPVEAEKAFAEAADLAETDGSYRGSYEYGLEALVQHAELIWNRVMGKSAKVAGKDIERLLDISENLAREAKRARPSRVDHFAFWATHLFVRIGEQLEDKDDDPVAAYKAYSRGLPENLNEAVSAHVRLVTARVGLFGKQKFAQRLQKVRPLSEMLQEAEQGIQLAQRDHKWIYANHQAEAYGAAGMCFYEAGKNPPANAPAGQARKHKEQAVVYLKEAVSRFPTHNWCGFWLLALGKQYRDLGKKDEARQAIDKARKASLPDWAEKEAVTILRELGG
jgi:serine/threonine protein kinase/tetratricopeptide (TPR) repeat protein